MTQHKDTKFLTGNNKVFFEKALQLYIFFRHVPLKDMQKDLRDRFNYDGNVVYSLITGYLEKDELSFEYMSYLNDELKTLSKLDAEYFNNFTILPSEIGEIELMDKVPLTFTDEENGKVYRMTYFKNEGKCEFVISD